MVTRAHLHLHDLVVRRPVVALLILAGFALGLAAGLGRARVDTSFRPLFADRGDDVAVNRDFEAVFGQPSGAHLGVVIRPADPLAPTFLARLSQVSGAVERLDHVVEVTSLARLRLPEWDETGAHGRWLVEPEALETGEGAATLARVLATGPEPARGLVSRDGERTLLLARVGLPLSDLDGRREVLRAFERVVTEHLGPGVETRFVGVSVVEDAYARIVLRSLGVSFALTTLAVLLVIGALFRGVVPVIVAMTGVSLATPASLGLSTLMGRDITILGSVVPILILVIGVADAIHMIESFGRGMRRGLTRDRAIRAMVADMALPCLLTTLTTALGFLALGAARITAVRQFGIDVALGVCLVYALNVAAIPALLRLVPASWWSARGGRDGPGPRLQRLTELVVGSPGRVVWIGGLVAAMATVGLGRVSADQRFNEELSPDHPIRADQALVEREFGGFLGPEILLRRRDGASLADPGTLARIERFVGSVGEIEGVHGVRSVLDLLPRGLAGEGARAGLDDLRRDPLLGPGTRELVAPGMGSAALLVRTGDLGTSGARRLARDIDAAAAVTLGPGIEATVTGQWWLAQRGMDALVSDLARSLFTSALLVLPLVLLFLRSVRLFLVSLVPNVLPILLALAFMGWMGITLRIGTAVVLAVALGIAVDDTLHLLVRLGRGSAGDPPALRVRRALTEAGGPIVTTTLVLVAGFLSMLANPLLAIRDMGTVGILTLIVALAADLLLAPALFLLVCRAAGQRSTSPSDAAYVPMRTPVLPADR